MATRVMHRIKFIEQLLVELHSINIPSMFYKIWLPDLKAIVYTCRNGHEKLVLRWAKTTDEAVNYSFSCKHSCSSTSFFLIYSFGYKYIAVAVYL